MDLAMDILQTAGLDIKFYKWAIFGPQFLRTLRNFSKHMIAAKEWAALASLMRCPYTHS